MKHWPLTLWLAIGQAGLAMAQAAPEPAPDVAAEPAAPQAETEQETSAEHSGGGLVATGWQGSLMFPTGELRRLNEALENYERRMRAGKQDEFENPAPEGTPESAAAAEQGPPKVQAKAFYLSTVAYMGPTEWTVWINGQVYTMQAAPVDFEIASVSRHQVTLRWKITPEELETIYPHWKEKVQVLESEDAPLPAPLPQASAEAKAERNLMAAGNPIYYVKSGQFLQFSLVPNQTFVSRGMEVVEGKVATSLVAPNDSGGMDLADPFEAEPQAEAPPAFDPSDPLGKERAASEKLTQPYKDMIRAMEKKKQDESAPTPQALPPQNATQGAKP